MKMNKIIFLHLMMGIVLVVGVSVAAANTGGPGERLSVPAAKLSIAGDTAPAADGLVVSQYNPCSKKENKCK